MKQLTQVLERAANRRTFLKNSMVAGAVATVGAGILGSGFPAFGQETSNSSLSKETLPSFDSSRPPNSSKPISGSNMLNSAASHPVKSR